MPRSSLEAAAQKLPWPGLVYRFLRPSFELPRGLKGTRHSTILLLLLYRQRTVCRFKVNGWNGIRHCNTVKPGYNDAWMATPRRFLGGKPSNPRSRFARFRTALGRPSSEARTGFWGEHPVKRAWPQRNRVPFFLPYSSSFSSSSDGCGASLGPLASCFLNSWARNSFVLASSSGPFHYEIGRHRWALISSCESPRAP